MNTRVLLCFEALLESNPHWIFVFLSFFLSLFLIFFLFFENAKKENRTRKNAANMKKKIIKNN